MDAITEMFKRSKKNYGVKYINYIGNSDYKTYTGIINTILMVIFPLLKRNVLDTIKKEWGFDCASAKKNERARWERQANRKNDR